MVKGRPGVLIVANLDFFLTERFFEWLALLTQLLAFRYLTINEGSISFIAVLLIYISYLDMRVGLQ